MSRKVSEILKEAGNKIGPDSWCQEIEAANAEGVRVAADSPEAVRWCLLGAIDACASDICDRLEAGYWIRGFMQRTYAVELSTAAWNDAPERKWYEVRRALYLAALEAEREGC